jgi:hypothetical protein
VATLVQQAGEPVRTSHRPAAASALLGHTHIPTVMIGERGADFLLQEHQENA